MSSSKVNSNYSSPMPTSSALNENQDPFSSVNAEQGATVKLPANTATDIENKADHAIHDLMDVKKDVNEKASVSPARSRAGSNASQKSNTQGLQSPKQGSGASTPKSGISAHSVVNDAEQATKDTVNKATEKLSGATEAASETANQGESVAKDAKAGAEQLAEDGKKGAENAADKGKEVAQEAKDKTSELAQSAKKTGKKAAKNAKQAVDNTTGQATETVKDGAADLSEAAKNAANETAESTQQDRKEIKNHARSLGSAVWGMGASAASMGGKAFSAVRGQSGKVADGALKLGKGTAAGVKQTGSAMANAATGAANTAAANAPSFNTDGLELPAKKPGRLASAADMTRSTLARPFVALNRGVQNAYANIGVARLEESHTAWGLLGLAAGAAGYALATASSLSLGIFLTPELASLGLAALSAAYLTRKFFRRVAYNPSSPEGLGANMSPTSRRVTLLQTEMERLRAMVEKELGTEAAALSKAEAKLIAQNDALKVKTAQIEQQKAIVEQSQKTVANSKTAITQIQVQEESKIANPGTLPEVSPATAVTNPITAEAAVQGNIVETTREQVEIQTIGEHVQSSTAPAVA